MIESILQRLKNDNTIISYTIVNENIILIISEWKQPCFSFNPKHKHTFIEDMEMTKEEIVKKINLY